MPALLDGLRLRRPIQFWGATAAVSVMLFLLAIGRPADAGAASGGMSALDALGGATGPTSAAASAAPFDVADLVVQAALVVILLFVTLRVLRRVQGGSAPADARIRVLETQTIASKTSLHLVAIDDREVLVGASPSGLVALAQLEARRPRLVALAGREGDLDLGRKQRRSLEWLRDLRTRPTDRRECGVALPLRQPKLRQPRLRLPAAPARLSIRGLRRIEFAAQPQELGLSIEREPRCRILRRQETLGREPCFLERLRP